MAFYTCIFSPETYEAFRASGGSIVKFHERHLRQAHRVKAGDFFVCYVTRASRWAAVLEATGEVAIASPETEGQHRVLVTVHPRALLPLEYAIPMMEDCIWTQLSFTREHPKTFRYWTAPLRTNLVTVADEDGMVITRELTRQKENPVVYPVPPSVQVALVRGTDRDVVVVVPEDEAANDGTSLPEVRESLQIQALLATIGSRMRLKVWIPPNDRARVKAEWKGDPDSLIERLPLNYDDVTLRTIEQIDVLWLKGRSIRRAFEVEHTTSIYSGILRMADLLALQPNMDIKLHIVAPEARREKVLHEIRRPVFSLIEPRSLAERCTYLSYDAVREIAALPHVEHLSDSVLDVYEEPAEI